MILSHRLNSFFVLGWFVLIVLLKLLQAECRAHRQGQRNGVNVYIFIAKDTSNESRWQSVSRSLRQVSSIMDGKYDVVQAMEVAHVSCHGEMDPREKKSEHLTTDNTVSGEVSGAKPTVTESQGMHLDLDPLEALCDLYRMDDEQYGASSLPSRLDLHYTVDIASDTCLILTWQRLVWQLQ